MARERVIVVKVGGNVVNDHAALDKFLRSFAGIQDRKVLVHGGGKLLDTLAARLGVEQVMEKGRRITGEETLELATMVYAGSIGKRIVARLQAEGCNAIGLTGADGGLIRAVKRPLRDGIDYGLVGDITDGSVNAEGITRLLYAGYVPVFSAITHDGNGQLLNTNADTVAFAIATALSADFEVQLHYCFEKKGVLRDVNDDATLVARIDEAQYRQMVAGNVVSAGMLPKLENAFSAIRRGVNTVAIGHPDDLLNAVNKTENAGTYLVA